MSASELGRTNYHEHLFQVSPLLPGDELDDEEHSGDEAALLRDSGFDAMIDATPYGLGRRPEALARISGRTGLTIVAATGAHREQHYESDNWLRQTDAAERARLFVADINDGLPADETSFAAATGARALSQTGDALRAGLIKTGIGYWSISSFERVTLEAAAAAHGETGVPIMVHLEFCTAAHEVLDLLRSGGVSPERVVLAHADRDPNPTLHIELAERGVYVGYDGMARPRTRSDSELLQLTERVVEAGFANRILLGGDVARRTRYLSYGGMPGLAYLGTRYLPLLRHRIGDPAVNRMLVDNAAHLLSF